LLIVRGSFLFGCTSEKVIGSLFSSQYIVVFVISTYSTEHGFSIYSKWFTGWAGSAGFSRTDMGWTIVAGFLSK